MQLKHMYLLLSAQLSELFELTNKQQLAVTLTEN